MQYDDPRVKGLPGDIYGRQSHGSDRSIDQQLKDGNEWAAREQAIINAVLSDHVSASPHSRHVRDDWPKLIEDIETGRIRWVWLWESSRGDRTAWRWLQLLETCRDKNVLIMVHSDRRLYDVANNPRDWHTLADDAVENQWESEKIRMRVLRDTEANAMNGGFHGPVPYGYERRYEMRRGRMAPVEQYAHPEEGPVITRLFDELDRKKPLRSIKRDFDAEGIRPRKGGEWGLSVLRGMALNYAYIGKRSHDPGWAGVQGKSMGRRRSEQARLYEGNWPALVDEAKFYRVRRMLLGRTPNSPRQGSVCHLVSNMAVCGTCDRPLKIRTWANGTRPPRYECYQGHVAVYETGLDQYVISEVLGYLSRPAVIKRLRKMSPAPGAGDDLAAAEAELEKWKAEKAALENALGNEPGLASTFVDAAKKVQGHIDTANARINALTAIPELAFLLDSSGEMAEAWDAAPLGARRDAIRKLARITVKRGGVKVPADRRRVTIEWLL